MSECRKLGDGRAADDQLVERLAAEAKAGFPRKTFAKPRKGRSWIDAAGLSDTQTIRLPASLNAALAARAEEEHVTPSEVIRGALSDYLAAN